MNEIEISPITRVEGSGKVTIFMDEDGNVRDAHFSVVDVRGFEKFLEGCALEDMPRFTARICGVCPVAHHLASVKACEDLLGVTPPESAVKVRELWLHLHHIHSHTAHLFALAAPDFLLKDAPPEERNIFKLAAADKDLAKKIIELRKFGQEGSRIIAGIAIHPTAGIIGGMANYFTEEKRSQIKELGKNAVEIAEGFLESYKKITEELSAAGMLEDGEIETNYMSLTNNGTHEIYDGNLKVVEKGGDSFEFGGQDYLKHIVERTLDYSFAKSPYLKEKALKEGILRVGPLARLNIAERLGTPRAEEHFKEFKKEFGFTHKTMLYNLARMIELLHSVERSFELLEGEGILMEEGEVRKRISEIPQFREGAGIGVVEAPRGSLIHHYATDKDGFITDMNSIVATTFNNPGIDESVKEIARKIYLDKKSLTQDDKDLNRIERTIRAYDPCLSCSAHSLRLVSEVRIEIVRNYETKFRTQNPDVQTTLINYSSFQFL
jgi:F420-non-reducing hydrogenase large subunit